MDEHRRRRIRSTIDHLDTFFHAGVRMGGDIHHASVLPSPLREHGPTTLFGRQER